MHPPVINGHSVDRFADLCVQIADLQAVLRVAVANPYGSCRPPIGDEHEATVCQKRWIDLAKFGEPRSRSTSPQTTARVTKRRRRVGGEITVCGHSAREKVRTFPPLVGGNRNVLKILQ